MCPGAGTESAASRVSSHPHIAVVDDDESLRLALVGLVRSMGFRATGFGSAAAFLASAELGTSDCLITDIHMPGLSGIDLQRHLAKRRPTLPIIMITARTDPGLREQAVAEGAVCVLMKPFEADMLASCLERALGN